MPPAVDDNVPPNPTASLHCTFPILWLWRTVEVFYLICRRMEATMKMQIGPYPELVELCCQQLSRGTFSNIGSYVMLPSFPLAHIWSFIDALRVDYDIIRLNRNLPLCCKALACPIYSFSRKRRPCSSSTSKYLAGVTNASQTSSLGS